MIFLKKKEMQLELLKHAENMGAALCEETAQHLLPSLCLASGSVIHPALSWGQNTPPKI